MASLKDKLQGKDPDLEAKRKKDSLEFQKQMGMEDVPEEPGIEEGDFLPNRDKELGAAGFQQGMVPFGPGGGLASEAATAAGEETGGQSLVQKLRDKGIPQEKIDKAAAEIRVKGSHTFVDDAGRPVMTVGEKSPLGQELKSMGQASVNESNSRAPGFRYSEEAVSGEGQVPPASGTPREPRGPQGPAKEFLDKTGVDIRNKTALEVYREMLKKGKK